MNGKASGKRTKQEFVKRGFHNTRVIAEKAETFTQLSQEGNPGRIQVQILMYISRFKQQFLLGALEYGKGFNLHSSPITSFIDLR